MFLVVALGTPARNADVPAPQASSGRVDEPQQSADGESRALHCAYLGTAIHAGCRIASQKLFTKERARDYTDPRAAADFFDQVCRHAGLYTRDDCAEKSQMGTEFPGSACDKIAGKIGTTVLVTCRVGIRHARGLRDATKACSDLFEATRSGVQDLCDQTTRAHE